MTRGPMRWLLEDRPPMGECMAAGCTDWRAWGLALCRRHESDLDERLEIFEAPAEVMILR